MGVAHLLEHLVFKGTERRTARELAAVHRAGYYRGNCVIAAAGHVDHTQLLTVLEREGWFEGEAQAPRAPVAPVPAERGAAIAEARDSNQSHIVLGTDTFG